MAMGDDFFLAVQSLISTIFGCSVAYIGLVNYSNKNQSGQCYRDDIRFLIVPLISRFNVPNLHRMISVTQL
ncbi:hypothetical protein V1477_021336 [Vespula maculifrons]|uniref:Uncharacterized protein n=1 Tax=Vespula maculifrons TaxID=7453 RepID=A0ABD2AHT7_VESMC